MSDSFTDSTPASDDDPYSSTSSQSSYDIDRNGFPKPIPIIGPLLGYDDKLFAQVTRLKIEYASKKLQRPLTSEEASAMAYWGAKQISIISYGTPIGVVAGAWRCYDTRARFRFPFYGPNMTTFNPLQFPNGVVFINGPRAPMVWHVFRALFYTGFGKFASSMLTGSYAMSVAAVGEMSDSRLKTYREKITSDAKANRPIGTGPRTPQSIPQQAGGQQAEKVGEASEEKPYDDASPSGGVFFDQTTTSSNAPVAMNEGAPEKVRPDIRQPGGWPKQSQVNREREERPFSMFDDASPTSGQGISSEPESSAPAGSAWERVRRGQVPAPPRPKQNSGWQQNQASQQPSDSAWAKQRKNSQDGNSSDDGFSMSSSQETKRYGKGEAQMEFDAKVERERKGGDFGDGDQKRW